MKSVKKRKGEIISISIPKDMAAECKRMAKSKGESVSSLFREMYDTYKKQKAFEEFEGVSENLSRKYSIHLTEEEIERICFEDR